MDVHPTAIVADGAVLGDGVTVGPYCVVGPKVRIGPHCTLHAHVVVEGDTELGSHNELWPFVCVGASAQDRSVQDDEGSLRVGSHNRFREYVTIHRGTPKGGGVTRVGNHNMLLCAAHLGHDVKLGNHVTLTNGALMAGHVEIQDQAVVGATAGLHQFARIGRMAMVGAGGMVSKDVPPYALVQGDRARIRGVNLIGMRRSGMSSTEISAVKRAYRLLFWRGGSFADRMAHLERELGDHQAVQEIVEFLRTSRRGVLIARGPRDSGECEIEPMGT